MGFEIWALVGGVVVLMAVIIAQAVGFLMNYDVRQALGNREDVAPPTGGLYGRASRAARNHVEGLAMYAPLVLAASMAGALGGQTELGAQLFLAGRVAHAAMYLLGVPFVRSAAFGVGLTGIVLTLVAVVSAGLGG